MGDQRSAPAGDDSADGSLSPVVGATVVLVLTLVITVAVGTFVVPGDEDTGEERAPEANFDVEERTVHLTDATASANLTQVRITVDSGETLYVPGTDVTVEGDDTAVGLVEIESGEGDVVAPMPDVRRAYRAGEAVPVEPGHTWNVVAYDWIDDANVTNQTKVLHYRATDGSRPNRSAARAANEAEDTDGDDRLGLMPLFPGDEVRVVWRADSGPENVTLARYTVDGPSAETST